MISIQCSDRLHASRSGVPGWSASLGTSSVECDGMLCRACASARDVEATEDDADIENSFSIRVGGAYRFVRVRKYDGEIIGVREWDSTIASAVAAGVITTTQRNAFLAILAALRDHAKAQG